MDVQDHTTHSGHDGHEVHLCHRCGWPFPNPHPSAIHRRAHKKICGTIEGYTILIGSDVVSDDEHEHEHNDEHDKEKIPSPKFEIKGSFSRSEDVFADAATEFVDSGTTTGSANKNLDRDIFFSFKDAENAGGTNEVLNAAPVETSKVDASVEVTEIKTACDSSESNLELTGTRDPVKDEVVGPIPVPEPSYVSNSEEAKAIDVMEAKDEKSQESQISETITEEAKDQEITKTAPEVSAVVGGYHDNVNEENIEKLEPVTVDGVNEEMKHVIKPDCEHVSEVVKESEIVEKLKLDGESAAEVVSEEINHEHVSEAAKEAETDQNVLVVNKEMDLAVSTEQIQEVVKEPVADLTEKKNLDAPELEKSSGEHIQETVKEPVAVLIEKEDLGEPQLEKQSIEHTHEVVEQPDAIVTEKDLCTPELEGSSKEQIQEAVKEPDTVFTADQDLGAPGKLKKCTQENIIEDSDSVLTEKEDLGAHKSETCSNGEVIEQKVNNDRNLVADVGSETVTLKDSLDSSVAYSKGTSGVEEGNGTLLNIQDSGAVLTVDSSSPNSLEGTCGSASVLSTASIDAETLHPTEKTQVNSGKSTAATTNVYEPPSFMTLVEPKNKDNKSGSSELQDSQQQQSSEASQAGWFPTLTEVNNESEGRKKNEEAMAKVTNLSSGKHSTPLKNLLGEARSPSGKQPEPVVQKDEAAVNPSVNDDGSSPPKLIDDGKKGRKKVKGISSWVPFGCCSSVNSVK